jgi:hypothetical protein
VRPPLRQTARQGADLSVVIVVRSGHRLDDGVVVHVEGYAEAMRFASDWRGRHPDDRVSILTAALEPLAVLDGGHSDRAQSGRDAFGTLS